MGLVVFPKSAQTILELCMELDSYEKMTPSVAQVGRSKTRRVIAINKCKKSSAIFVKTAYFREVKVRVDRSAPQLSLVMRFIFVRRLVEALEGLEVAFS